MVVSEDGIVIVGVTDSALVSPNYDGFVVKLDLQGNREWIQLVIGLSGNELLN